jgi:GNAT superfamily N-acetyltransferase
METDDTLETGYGDSTPAGDNLLNDFARGEATAFGALAAARGDRVMDDDALQLALLDSGSPAPYGNLAIARRPLGDGEWQQATMVMHEFFAQQPGGTFLVFAAWPTPDLRAFGFGLVGHPPLMARPPSPIEVPAIPGFEIRAVQDAPSAEAWESVLVDGYPVPELQPFSPGCFLPESALAAAGWTHYLGVLDGRAVATASAYVHDQYVQIEMVSALPDVRRRGLGHAITAAATATTTDRPAMLIASDAGKPTYLRMGYVPLLRYTLWAGHRDSPS